MLTLKEYTVDADGNVESFSLWSVDRPFNHLYAVYDVDEQGMETWVMDLPTGLSSLDGIRNLSQIFRDKSEGTDAILAANLILETQRLTDYKEELQHFHVESEGSKKLDLIQENEGFYERIGAVDQLAQNFFLYHFAKGTEWGIDLEFWDEVSRVWDCAERGKEAYKGSDVVPEIFSEDFE